MEQGKRGIRIAWLAQIPQIPMARLQQPASGPLTTGIIAALLLTDFVASCPWNGNTSLPKLANPRPYGTEG